MTASPFDDESSQALNERLVVGLNKIGLASRQRSWRGAEELALTPTQGQILAYLRASAEGARLSTVAAALAVSVPTASDAVQALIGKGLVGRGSDPADRRAVRLALTGEGRRVAERVAGWSDLLLGAVAELSEAEQAVMLRALVKMIRALQLRGELPAARMCPTCDYFRPNAYPGAERPHHCAFVDAPFGDRRLRIDCPDHLAAVPDAAGRIWEEFLAVAD